MTKVFLTDRALRDLNSIEAYSTVHWGDETAQKYLAKFELALELIQANPNILQSREEYSDLLLFYRVAKHWLIASNIEGNVYVLAVRHGAVDILSRLDKLEPKLWLEAELLHGKVSPR